MLLITDVPHLGEFENERCWVYALVDPRTSEVRYVGASQNLRQRTREHARGFSGSQTVGKWTRELRKAGLKPQVYLLQLVVETERRQVAEVRWIRGCVERGARLLNTIYVKAELDRIEGKAK